MSTSAMSSAGVAARRTVMGRSIVSFVTRGPPCMTRAYLRRRINAKAMTARTARPAAPRTNAGLLPLSFAAGCDAVTTIAVSIAPDAAVVGATVTVGAVLAVGVGDELAADVGSAVGTTVGGMVTAAVGRAVGTGVGATVGATVGAGVATARTMTVPIIAAPWMPQT